jgi:hypothetical protein
VDLELDVVGVVVVLAVAVLVDPAADDLLQLGAELGELLGPEAEVAGEVEAGVGPLGRPGGDRGAPVLGALDAAAVPLAGDEARGLAGGRGRAAEGGLAGQAAGCPTSRASSARGGCPGSGPPR